VYNRKPARIAGMTIVNSYGILLYREGKRKKKNRRQTEVFLIKPKAEWKQMNSL
jgi:hypothetical protein